MVMAHVSKEATLQEDGPGSLRQRIEVETEQIIRGDEHLAVNSGLRINIYQQELKRDSDQEAIGAPVRVFTYGSACVFPPRFLRRATTAIRARLTIGAICKKTARRTGFDQAGSIEVLPGFSGSRAELWRSRIHRSIIDKVHALWPPRQAALMDAMVIGEDAFINGPTQGGATTAAQRPPFP
jgi:hypothetical protein